MPPARRGLHTRATRVRSPRHGRLRRRIPVGHPLLGCWRGTAALLGGRGRSGGAPRPVPGKEPQPPRSCRIAGEPGAVGDSDDPLLPGTTRRRGGAVRRSDGRVDLPVEEELGVMPMLSNAPASSRPTMPCRRVQRATARWVMRGDATARSCSWAQSRNCPPDSPEFVRAAASAEVNNRPE